MTRDTPHPSDGRRKPGDPTGPPDTDGLRWATLRGASWSYGALAATTVLQLAYTAVMARLLSPSDFGVVALAQVFLQLLFHFARAGIGSAVVQRPQLTAHEVRGATTLATAIGALAALTTVALAPLAGWLAREPAIVPVLRVLGISFLIAGMGAVATALLTRSMDFRALARLQVLGTVVGFFVVGVPLAAMGAGVWALVGSTLAQTGVTSLGAYAVVRHEVRPTRDRAAIAPIARFGGAVSLVGFLEFLTGSTDTFAAGRVYGAGSLGQYTRATLLVAVPAEKLSTAVTRAMLPALARIQTDLDRSRDATTAAAAVIWGLVVPICAFAIAAAEPLVQTVLGPGWDPAAAVMPIVALATALASMTHVLGVAAEARGRMQPKVVIQLLQLAVTVTFVVLAVASDGGLEGLALAWCGGEAVRLAAYVAWTQRSLQDPHASLRRIAVQTAVLAAVPAGCAWLLVATLGPQIDAPATLAAAALVWAAASVGATRVLPDLVLRTEARRLAPLLPARLARLVGVLIGHEAR